MKFSSFLDKKTRQARKELGIIKDVLEEADLEVEDHLEEDSPYLFLKKTTEDLHFAGVRIYKVGSDIAFRIQNENKTEPYGAAYSLNVEEMFGSLITDMGQEEAAEQIKKAVVEEFKNFFQKSSDAQNKINSMGADSYGKIIVSKGAGDISNTMSMNQG